MSAFLLLNQCDSVATKVCGVAVPVVQETHEAGTNWANVEITKSIMCSIVLIAAIVTVGFLLWKLIDHLFEMWQKARKRKWDEADKKLQAKNSLYERLLDFMKTQTEIPNSDKEKKVKGFFDQECVAYKETICGLLDISLESSQSELLKKVLGDQDTSTGQPSK